MSSTICSKGKYCYWCVLNSHFFLFLILKDVPKKKSPNIEMPLKMRYYLSLESPLDKNIRIKIGDCVYIYRHAFDQITSKHLSAKISDNQDIDSESFIQTIKKAADSAIANRNEPFDSRKCIIIRVQHLAIIEDTKQKVLFGHHYIWPSETYHEPTRKFYPNELLRSPLCEWAAVEEVRKLCVILDPSTYVKGHPIGYEPDDIYICEMRVDRKAKSFSRIPKAGHFPVNIKKYAFVAYKEKLKIKRTYSVSFCYSIRFLFINTFSSLVATSNTSKNEIEN